MRKIGVERDGVSLFEVVGDAVADKPEPAGQHNGGLAAARLVDRRVPRTGRGSAGNKGVMRHLGALTRDGWSKDLVAMTVCPPSEQALRVANDGHSFILVEAKELRERQLESACDAARDRQRRARLAALERPMPSRRARTLGPTASASATAIAVRYHGQMYVALPWEARGA